MLICYKPFWYNLRSLGYNNIIKTNVPHACACVKSSRPENKLEYGPTKTLMVNEKNLKD